MKKPDDRFETANEKDEKISSQVIRALVVVLCILFAINLVRDFFSVRKIRTRQDSPLNESEKANLLILGEQGREGELQVPLTLPIDINDIPLPAVLRVRGEIFEQHKDLLQSSYVPSEGIFHRIKDIGKWLSESGYYIHGPGQDAWRGKSVESLQILNPLLLIAPDFLGTSRWGSARLHWKDEVTAGSYAQEHKFPFRPLPESITLQPRNRLLVESYDLSGYSNLILPFVKEPVNPVPTTFTPSFINSRDMGFRLVSFLSGEAVNCTIAKDLASPLKIKDFFSFWQGIFGVNEGINHRSRSSSEFRDISISQLPAECPFVLWQKDEPGSAPDLKVVVALH